MDKEPDQRTWAGGCAIGCAAVVVTALVAGIVVYRVASSRLVQARDEIRDAFGRTYAEWDHVGKIPEEHRELLDGLVTTTRSSEASVYGVAAVSAAIRCVMQDGAIAEPEIEMLNALKKLLAENPGPSLVAAARFRDQFPELRAFSEREQP